MGFRHDRSLPPETHRVNHRIRIPQIRVIGSDGVQIGVMDTPIALKKAREEGLDLVEISPKASPPVCKIMDYGKFKFEESKKKKQERANRSTVEVKEMKFRPKTDDHDFDFKVKHIREFLQEGNKVRMMIQFRGREIVHQNIGLEVLQRVVEACADIAQIEQAPSMEGKRMFMLISPKTGKKPAGSVATLLPPKKVSI